MLTQTGFTPFEIDILTMPLQATISATDSFGYITRKGTYDNLAKYVDNGTPVYPTPTDEDVPLLGELEKVVAQCWTAVRSIVLGGSYPVRDTDVDDNLLSMIYREFMNGICNQKIGWFDKDAKLTAETVLTDALEGISWGDDAAALAVVHHAGWFSRLFYVMGLAYAKDFPKLATRIENTNHDVVFLRNIEALLFLATKDLMDFFYLAAGQSDVGVFNIASLYEGIVSKRVPEEVFHAIESLWSNIANEDKFDVLGSTLGTGSGALTTLTGNFVAHTLIEATTISNAIFNWKTKFKVSNWALNKARTLFGIGKYEKHGETVHFANLFNGVVADDGGDYDDHGETTWELGVNLSIMIDYLTNCKGLVDDYLQYVDKKGYTWTEVTDVYKVKFTEFSVLTSLKGFAEPEAYRPMRRSIGYTGEGESGQSEEGPLYTTGWRSKPVHFDPQELLTADEFETGNDSYETGCEWAYLIFADQLPDYAKLHMPYDWEEREVYNSIWFGLLLDCTSGADITNAEMHGIANTVAVYHWTSRRMRVVTMVDVKQPEKIRCLAYSDDTQNPKWEDVDDVLDFTNYLDTALKYGMMLVYTTPSEIVHNMRHRPKGWPEAPETTWENIGNVDVARQILKNAVGMSSSGKTAAPDPAPQVADKEVGPNTEGDNEDGTEA